MRGGGISEDGTVMIVELFSTSAVDKITMTVPDFHDLKPPGART
jgi:hypothetical protein